MLFYQPTGQAASSPPFTSVCCSLPRYTFLKFLSRTRVRQALVNRGPSPRWEAWNVEANLQDQRALPQSPSAFTTSMQPALEAAHLATPRQGLVLVPTSVMNP